eukprot:7623623-Alexandrium_andersonii.AAC.1
MTASTSAWHVLACARAWPEEPPLPSARLALGVGLPAWIPSRDCVVDGVPAETKQALFTV